MRDLAGSLTAFGPVSPTLLRDHAGALSACLFLPSSLDALPLARFARDLHLALEGAEVGRMVSVVLKLGAHRLVLRAMDGASGSVTMLVGVGRIDPLAFYSASDVPLPLGSSMEATANRPVTLKMKNIRIFI